MRPTAWQLCALLAPLALLPACGKGDDRRGAAGSEEPAEPGSAGSETAAAEPPRDREPRGFDHETFCERVFAPADVGALAGADRLVALPTQAGLAPGKAMCVVEADGALSATLAVDCGGADKIVSAWKEMYEKTSPGTFEEVDVGRGGVRISPAENLYQLGFLHDDADCAVMVLTRDLAVDVTLELARHAAARIREHDRPR